MKLENRDFDYDVLEEIQKRWSPRAFDPQRLVSEEDLMGILEAARFAPSCYNEQPWRYIVARRGEENYNRLASVLTTTNHEWASKASVLMLILSVQNFKKNDKKNRWHLFDAGTSWGFLSLEAQRRGLITHAMAGYSADRARELFEIPEDMSIIAAVAVGYYGNKESLSPKNIEQEKPSPRHSIQDMIYSKPADQ